jgi:putative transposase
MLTVIGEFTRECLATRVGRRLTAEDVQECLTELFCSRGLLEHIRSDNGPCYVSGELRRFLESRHIEHTRRAPYHPMTQGRIERYRRSMTSPGARPGKNLIQLQNCAFP